MRFFNVLTATFALSRVSIALPTSEEKAVKPITGTILSTGTTEAGEPYTITHGTRLLSDSELSQWKAIDTVNVTETSLEKREGEGTSANCNQWYSNKYCYCGGAITNRGDTYWGSQDHCAAHANDRGGTGIYGNSESNTIKWLPTVTIQYKIINSCGWTYTIGHKECGDLFLHLFDWCQWTWMTQKGGFFRLNNCITYWFDVNQR
ncbi:hypothetical protein B0J11DRAFT_579646 [Dendryphion nanum]|uniref:Uncharacterized protein n=1 Tax=Dendryphion nanum TaxID=256645 RepID=A0A9P9DXU3_9PLEO|nr:hypothetical protein B0J11DRAFT_579646 [Dendryphion nanum]